MRRLTVLSTVMAVLALLTGPSLLAQRGGGGGGGAGRGVGAAGDRGGIDRGADRGAGERTGAKGNPDSNQGAVKTPGELLTHNTRLASKLQPLLPAGTDLEQASQGFKNLGGFVAAAHVSHNLGIPFDQLKARMIGPPSESLGKAIQALKPEANHKEEAKRGEKEAKDDIHASEAIY